MLPKLQLPNKGKLQDYLPKDKYLQDQNILASQIQKLTAAISHLCGSLQLNLHSQKQLGSPTHRADETKMYDPKQMPAPELINGKNMDSATAAKEERKQQQARNVRIVNENEDIEERFREIAFQIKKIQENENRNKQIQKFLANLLSKVLTRGFYYYEKGLFNDKKYRNFCCSNILLKIIEFAKLNSVTENQFNFMNEHLGEKVLPYQKCTYPKAQSQQINLKFSEIVYEINNLDANQNDLILQSKIKFSKKKSGDYTAEIMKLINFILEKTRATERIHQEGQQDKEQALSEFFLKQMSDFFERVYNERWVTRAKKNDPSFDYSLQEISQFETKFEEQSQKKEDYQKKVKSYTKFQIGVKISENLRKFSTKNILQQNLQLTNSGMMRVLTKWSEELEEYIFNTNESIINRQQNFIMMDGSQSYLPQSERLALAVCLQNQRAVIEKYLEQMKKNMGINQYKAIHSRRVQQFKQFATENEANVGCFATMAHKSNANYLINYLNKLIDCILAAQVDWYIKQGYQELSCGHLIPSLISFNIGDLMRCKISSKQREIAALFNYLTFTSRTNPEKIEIVRIKNKLRQGTKDVLINFRYKKSIIVEMQLAIEEEKSTFIQCSEKANHFIYELERARFGPLSEICNIWCGSDERYKYFSSMFEQLNSRPIKKQFSLCQHKMKQEKFPIWCRFCEGFVSNLSLVTPHLKCYECNVETCFKCLCKYGNTIVANDKKMDKSNLLSGKQRNGDYKIVKVIDIENKTKKQKNFILLRIKNQFVIFEKVRQNEFDIKLESENHKKIINYFSNFLILQAIGGSSQTILQYLKSEYFRRYFERARIKMNRIILYQGKASLNLIQSQRYIYVKKLCLISAQLKSIGQMPSIFPLCQIAILNKNQIQNFTNIEKWKTLRELHLEQNRINHFSQGICELLNLNKLNLYQNNIASVPQNLGKLINLMELNLSANGLVSLPESVKNLTKLKQLNIMWNRIKNLPPDIFDGMNGLRKFLFKENQITEFPPGLPRLQNIQQIFLGCNKISVINLSQPFKWKKLKLLIIRQNSLTSVPNFIGGLENLEQCNLEENQLTHFEPGLWQCWSLKSINLNMNKLLSVPSQLASCESLQKITAETNKIQNFEDTEWKLKKLRVLLLSSNYFKVVPKIIGSFPSLQVLNLSNNPLVEFEPCDWVCENLKELNLFRTGICEIPPFIEVFKQLKQFQIGNGNDVELSLPQLLLAFSEELVITIPANFRIKADSEKTYEKLSNRKQIIRKKI